MFILINCLNFCLQTEIELLKAHNIRLLNFPPLTKVCLIIIFFILVLICFVLPQAALWIQLCVSTVLGLHIAIAEWKILVWLLPGVHDIWACLHDRLPLQNRGKLAKHVTTL